jgi:hypothetical protein
MPLPQMGDPLDQKLEASLATLELMDQPSEISVRKMQVVSSACTSGIFLPCHFAPMERYNH